MNHREAIPGPMGLIEISADIKTSAACHFVMCHPHPLHGGTMHNKVVTTALKAATNVGMNAITFNFRGVGKSEGKFDEGLGEQQDLCAVLDWLDHDIASLPLILGGFSFGSYVAAAQAHQHKVNACVSIAPAVTRFDFSAIDRGTFPWFVLQGNQDEVVEFSEVQKWFSRLGGPKHWFEFDGVGHFFHGQLLPLRHQLELILSKSLG